LIASLVGTLATLPYSWSLLKQAKTIALPQFLVPIALTIGVILELLISAATILLGIALGKSVGLGAMLVPATEPLSDGRARRWWRLCGEPMALGLTLGVIIAGFSWALDPNLPKNEQPLVMPTAWEGLLASFGAGIREEIWLRFGLMTLLVWLGATLARRNTGRSPDPSPAVYHAANVLAALAFAAIHIPQAQILLGLSALMLVFIFVGNGLPALVFGWLYWKRGLLTAMVAHFGLDLVLKVFIPLLG
jgi:hypothetical protein